MTPREQLAEKVECSARAAKEDAVIARENGMIDVECQSEMVADYLTQAVYELRKTCRTCRHFQRSADIDELLCHVDIDPESLTGMFRVVPQDGSGFCHRWEEK